MLPNIQGRAVYIVVRPWDYRTADVFGVFDTNTKAILFAQGIKEDDSGNKIESNSLLIIESFIE